MQPPRRQPAAAGDAARHPTKLNTGNRKHVPMSYRTDIPGTLNLTFIKGQNMLNRETLSCSDPYIKVFDQFNNMIFKTQVRKGTTDPVWAGDAQTAKAAKKDAEKPEPEKHRTSLRLYEEEGEIRLEAWDSNAISDAPLGEVHIPIRDLIGCNEMRSFQLRPGPEETDKLLIEKANELGTLSVQFAYTEEPLTTQKAQEPSTEPVELPAILNFTVASAMNLLNRETTGTSDPYVVVLAPDGGRILKTPTVSSSTNPDFIAKAGSKAEVESRIRVKTSTMGNLTFQVWDSNALSDDLMGEARVPVSTALEFSQRNAGAKDGPKISLILRPREREEDEVLVENASALGTLQVHFKLESENLASASAKPPGTLNISVDSARDLLVRRVVGTPSQFVRIRDRTNKVIFETHQSDTSARHPGWRETEASTEIRLYDVEPTSTVTIEVWDKRVIGELFLGQAVVTHEEALKYATQAETTLPLLCRMNDPDREVRVADTLGRLTLQFRFTNELTYHAKREALEIAKARLLREQPMQLEPPGRLTLELQSCKNLVGRNEHAPSPYVTVVDPYGEKVFESKTMKDASPKFDGTENLATVRLAHTRGIIRLQVWDKRTLGSDLIGEACISVLDAIAYVSVQNPTFQLRPREREEDRWLVDQAKQPGGLGSITVGMTFSSDQTPIPPDVVVPPGMPVRGVFTVTVLGCKELNNFESTGTSDPFIRIRRGNGGHQIHKLPYCKNTLDPTWTQKNVIDIPVNAAKRLDEEQALVFELWDHNTIVNDRMGDVILWAHDAWRYCEAIKTKQLDSDVISVPLRMPLNEAEHTKDLEQNAHRLGTMQLQIEFTEGDDKKTAAEIEREDLFNMDVPLEYVINHIERSHDASVLSRELLLYVPFLVMFIFFSLARRDTLQEHYIAGGFAQQFTLHEIPPTLYHEGREQYSGLHHYTAWWELQTMKELHMWFQGVVVPHFWDWRHPQVPSKNYGPFGFNKALGSVRARVKKMRQDSCDSNAAFIPENSSSYNLACFESLVIGKEQIQPLVYPVNNFTVNYTHGCDHAFTEIAGDLYTITCGGYIVDLPVSSSFNNTLEIVRTLEAMGFTNETDTRFFALEWFTYNPALDMFTSSKYFIEITNGGGWVPSAQLRSFRVDTDGSTGLFFIYDIIFTLFVAYYWVKFFRDWRRYYRRRKEALGYLLSMWTFLEFCNLSIFIVALGFHFEWYRASWEFTDDLEKKNPDDFPELLNYILNLFYGEIFSNAANAVLSFLKILKFLQMNSKLNILTRTMGRAAENIVGVLLIFLLIMLAYSLSGVQLYGTQLYEFRNLAFAMSTLFRALMGSFEYEEMRIKNRATTFIYFWSFIILGLFVMLNFITAIIGSAYEAEQDAEHTLPVAIQIRRTLRELKTFSLARTFRTFVQTVVKRTRRHPDDIIFEHVSQLRSVLLQRDNIDEDLIRRGEEEPPNYLINYHKFKAAIPKADAEYIGIPVVDNTYHAIAEDFAVLHRDEEKEHEDDLAAMFEEAIHTGFSRVLIDRLPEITTVQRCLLTGASLPVFTEAVDEIDQTATDEAADAAVKRVGAEKKGTNDRDFADLAAKVTGKAEAAVRKTDDAPDGETEIGFDPLASTKKLFVAIDDVHKELPPATQRQHELVPSAVKAEQKRVTRIYMESAIGNGRTGGGVLRAAEEIDTLKDLISNLFDVTCARSYAMHDSLMAAAEHHRALRGDEAAEA